MKRHTLAWSAVYALLILLFQPSAAHTMPYDAQVSLIREAQAGVCAVAILEDLHTPATLHTTKTQAFIDATFQRFRALAPSVSPQDMKRMRKVIRDATPSQLAPIQQQFLNFEARLLSSKTPEHRDAWLVGVRAMQISYNALHTKDRHTADTLLDQLALLSALDPVLPAIHDLRTSLQTVHLQHASQETWPQQAIAAGAIATIIAAFGTPHQQIVAALAILRAPGIKTPLQTPYVSSVEIISADGNIRTMSGYSDGTAETPMGRLHCSMDHARFEPAGAAIPLTIPLAPDDALSPSVQHLIGGCNAFEQNQPPVSYLPPSSVPEAIIPHLLQSYAPLDWDFILASMAPPSS